MRIWRALIEALTSSPRGWNADGRTLGLGLATAMAEQRNRATRTVEDYLSREAAEDRPVSASRQPDDGQAPQTPDRATR